MGPAGLGIPGLEGIEWVAAGGHGDVYRARQPALDRIVAVKVLAGADANVRRRFDRERRAMGRLSQHPGILTVYESGFTSDGNPYLLTPFIERGSLQDRLDAYGKLDPETALPMIAAVARTLQFAHDRDVIHADLKPSNILIDQWGSPLIADFGVARITSFDHTQTTSTAFSPSYAAPEALAGEPPTVSTDVYGLAVLAYVMLEGSTPHSSETTDLLALSKRIEQDPVPPLSAPVPTPVASTIERSLAKQPTERPARVSDIADAIDGVDVHADSDTRQAFIGSLLVAVALVTAASAIAWAWSEDAIPSSGAAVTQVPTSVASPQTGLTLQPGPISTAAEIVATTSQVAPTTTLRSPPDDPFSGIDPLEIPVTGELGPPIVHDGYLWVSRTEPSGAGSIVRLDPDTGSIVDITEVGRLLSGPTGSQGQVWVHAVGDGELVGIDAESGAVIDRVDVGAPATRTALLGGIQLDAPVVADDGSIWLTRFDDSSIIRHDPDGVTAAIDYPLFVTRPTPAGSGVWINYATMCNRPEGVWEGTNATLAGYDIPVVGPCYLLDRLDSASESVTVSVQRNWMSEPMMPLDPQGTGTWLACSGSRGCRAEEVPNSIIFANSELLAEPERDEAVFEPVTNAGAHVLVHHDRFEGAGSTEPAAVYFADPNTGDVISPVVSCGDSLWVTADVIDGRLWLTSPLDGVVCVHELSAILAGHEDEAILRLEGRKFTDAPIGRPVDAGIGGMVWVTADTGVARLLASSGSEVVIVHEAMFSPGLTLPHVEPDGHLWITSPGRIHSLDPSRRG